MQNRYNGIIKYEKLLPIHKKIEWKYSKTYF